MVPVRKLWPLGVAVLLATVLNVDISVVPYLLKVKHMTPQELFLPIAILADTELLVWWWFWGWVGKFILELNKIRQTINFGRDIDHQLDISGIRTKIILFVEDAYLHASHPDNKIIKRIKAWGHTFVFVSAFEPVPATRIPVLIFCRLFRWKSGFITLMVANILHVAAILWGWELYPRIMITFVSLSLLISFLVFIKKMNGSKQN